MRSRQHGGCLNSIRPAGRKPNPQAMTPHLASRPRATQGEQGLETRPRNRIAHRNANRGTDAKGIIAFVGEYTDCRCVPPGRLGADDPKGGVPVKRVGIAAGVIPHPLQESVVPVVQLRQDNYRAGLASHRTLQRQYAAPQIADWQGHAMPPQTYQLPDAQLAVSLDANSETGTVTLRPGGDRVICRDATVPLTIEWMAFCEALLRVGYFLIGYAKEDGTGIRSDLPVYLGTSIRLQLQGDDRNIAQLQYQASALLRIIQLGEAAVRRGFDPAELIHAIVGYWLVPDQRYHSRLPRDLARWYCYDRRGGHGVLVAPRHSLRDEIPVLQHMVHIPVKTALRGYAVTIGGVVVVDLPRDPAMRATMQAADVEYDMEP